MTKAGELVEDLVVFLGIQASPETGLTSCCGILETSLAHWMILDPYMFPELLVTWAGELVADLVIFLGIQAPPELGSTSCCGTLESSLAH